MSDIIQPMILPEILYILITGVIQGVTELLPISSSGHLILLSQIMSRDIMLTEIAILHIGTLVAIIVSVKNEIREILNKEALIKILISIIPAGIIGLLFNNFLETALSNPLIIVLSLILWGIVMIITDIKASTKQFHTNNLSMISNKQALLVGLGQVLALIPGTSRSGITTITGIAAGIDPSTSISFSFLSGIPLITASGLYSILKMNSVSNTNMSMTITGIIIATIISFLVGTVATWTLKKFIKKRILTICGIYRIILGVLLMVIL